MPSKNRAVGTDAKLKRAFPKDVSAPALLFDFAEWYRGQPEYGLGGIEFFDRDAEDLMPPHANCRDDFALFINMPDGGAAGLWLLNDRNPDSAPFVLLDSEGGFATLAPNFACFLDRLSKKQFDRHQVESDFLPFEDEEDRTEVLAVWLAKHSIAAPAILANGLENYIGYDDGTAAAWLKSYLNNLEQAALSDPDIRALSDALIVYGHRPEANEFGYACNTFRVFAAGKTMTIKEGAAINVTPGVNDLGNVPEDLQSLLRPPLFRHREKFAAARKGNGLWPSASMTIDDKGIVEVIPNYHHEFAIGLSSFKPKDFAEDQKVYPRPMSKIQPWQKALIESG